MSSDLRIRRDRSALSNGSLFGRRRRGIDPWKLVAWFLAMAFLGAVMWQYNKIQPQVAAMIGVPPTATPPAISLAQAADRAFWRGDLAAAITNYRQAVKQQPANVEFSYQLARMLIYHSYEDLRYQQTDWPEALEVSNKALEYNPNNSRAYTINCFALLTISKSEDAVRACIRAIDINPNEADAYAYLASADADLTRYDAALEAGQKAVQLDPSSIDGRINFAWVLRYKGRNDAALEQFKAAVDINPQLEFPYFSLAYFAIGVNKYEIAINSYNRVLSMNKHSVKAYTRLCETYYRMGEPNMASDNCSSAISLDPGYTAAHKWLGQVHYTGRDYEDAILDFEKCAEQQADVAPDDRLTECWYLRGLAWFILGNCDKAMPIFTDLLQWTHDRNAIEKTNIGINKCATAYQGQYKTPTPVPPTPTRPPPIQ